MNMTVNDNRPWTGRFISFEGIDGAGKSTHIARLAGLLREQGVNVVLTREPGGTPLAEALREKLLLEPMDPKTEALLMFAARSDHIFRVIQPALVAGQWVLCDRFTDATFAYQGYARKFDLEVLTQLERMTQVVQCDSPVPLSARYGQAPTVDHRTTSVLLQPDATFWFDLSPLIAAERLVGARVPDKFESQPLAFFDLVRAGYRARADADPARVAVIDAQGTPEQVFMRLHAAAAAYAWWPKESGR